MNQLLDEDEDDRDIEDVHREERPTEAEVAMNEKLDAQTKDCNESNYADEYRKSRYQFITELQSQWIIYIDLWLQAIKKNVFFFQNIFIIYQLSLICIYI